MPEWKTYPFDSLELGDDDTHKPFEDYMLVTAAAAELKITPQRVRQLVAAGQLRARKLSPRLLMIDRASVERYRKTRRGPGRPRKSAAPTSTAQ